MATYKIIRFFVERPRETMTTYSGLSLVEAQKHCQNPENSSRTCKQQDNLRRTLAYGPWFDGYEKE